MTRPKNEHTTKTLIAPMFVYKIACAIMAHNGGLVAGDSEIACFNIIIASPG